VEPWAIKNLDTAAAVVFNPELCDPHPAAVDQSWSGLDALSEHIHQGSAGAVLNVKHPMAAVGGLKRRRQRSVGIAIECHAKGEQALDAVGSLVHQKADGIAVTQSCPGFQSVVTVEQLRVFWACDSGDASLSPAARRTPPGISVEKENIQVRRQLQAGHQTSCTCSNNHNIPGAAVDRILGC